jgi:hypothetical protein
MTPCWWLILLRREIELYSTDDPKPGQDICFERPEKYIPEVLDAIVKFQRYKAWERGTASDGYSHPCD